jgi:hypothetical protein
MDAFIVRSGIERKNAANINLKPAPAVARHNAAILILKLPAANVVTPGIVYAHPFFSPMGAI